MNRMTCYDENTPKSFSKTLTQSELRDIVYAESDVILMETLKQQRLNDGVNMN